MVRLDSLFAESHRVRGEGLTPAISRVAQCLDIKAEAAVIARYDAARLKYSTALRKLPAQADPSAEQLLRLSVTAVTESYLADHVYAQWAAHLLQHGCRPASRALVDATAAKYNTAATAAKNQLVALWAQVAHRLGYQHLLIRDDI